MQRAELEELRQREANLTALQAIGPRKKPKLEGPGGAGDSVSNGATNSASGFVSIVAIQGPLLFSLMSLLFHLSQSKSSEQLVCIME